MYMGKRVHILRFSIHFVKKRTGEIPKQRFTHLCAIHLFLRLLKWNTYIFTIMLQYIYLSLGLNISLVSSLFT